MRCVKQLIGVILIMIGLVVFVVSIFNPADLLIGGELLGIGIILMGIKRGWPRAKVSFRLPKM